MSIDEIFKNPTVKQVIFQINFPNLFSIENKIGDYQLKIMDEFPNSTLIYERPFLLTNQIDEEKLKELNKGIEPIKKIWQFNGDNNKYNLNISSDSLSITSEFHKTYNNNGEQFKFRDIIKKCVDAFLDTTKLPVITRIGLRYIDDCPLPDKMGNEDFLNYYNSVLPLKRFDLNDTRIFEFRTETKRGQFHLRYIEILDNTTEKPKYNLDFDGFTKNIKSEEYLSKTDELHELISNEYELTIKEPVKLLMRKD